MIKQSKGQSKHDSISEIKKEIKTQIDEIGYVKYRLSQQEKNIKFVQQSGWKTVDGDKFLEEDSDE